MQTYMDILLGSNNPCLSAVKVGKVVNCAAFETSTSAALSPSIVYLTKNCQAGTPQLAKGTIATLPCVHCRHCAAFCRALLSLIARKDRHSGGPGSSGLSQAHIYLIEWKICRVWKSEINI